MNAGAFGENFPYSNFHDLNMDWIIKIAKDFLDQYTHIQETITSGEESLQNLTTSGLEQLQEKADALEALLQQWYETHSEDIAQQLATAIANFNTEAERIGANVIASIPPDYTALSEAVNAFYLLNEEQIVTYNYATKVLTIPGQSFCIYQGVPHPTTQQVLDLSNLLQNGACNLWMKSDQSIIATKFIERPEDTDALYLGSVYYRYVHINGISPNQIRIIEHGINNSIFPDNNGSFIGIENELRKVIVDISSRNIILPGGFKVYRGTTFPYSQETITYTSTIASKIWMKNTGEVYTTVWDDNTIVSPNDDCIGFIYGDTVKIAGIPEYCILVTNNDNQIIYGTGLFFGNTYLGIHQDQEAVYNYATKVLTIPAGFYVYRGVGRERAQTVLDLSEIVANESALIYITRAGVIYGKAWNSRSLENPTDQLVGYVYRKRCVLNGIDKDFISVITPEKTVYCFGDSITAGTNTTKNYLQIMHEFNRDIIFKNYAVGSTGIVVTATGSVIAGNGSTENGTATQVSGNNTVKQMIQSVSDTMSNIIIAAGTNDWGNDINLDQFTTAFHDTLITAKASTLNVFVLLPIKRQGWNTATNNLGLTLKDYADKMKAECGFEAVPFFDGYDIWLNPNLYSQRTTFMPDGLHPNIKGHKRIARGIYKTVLEAIGC